MVVELFELPTHRKKWCYANVKWFMIMLVANKVGLWGGVHTRPGQARMGDCALGPGPRSW